MSRCIFAVIVDDKGPTEHYVPRLYTVPAEKFEIGDMVIVKTATGKRLRAISKSQDFEVNVEEVSRHYMVNEVVGRYDYTEVLWG